jgi:hypothetical protein
VIRAFVSSTFRDLKNHRAYVIERPERCGIFVDPMEKWTAAGDEPKDLSTERVKVCQLCVLLVGFRRWACARNDRSMIGIVSANAISEKGCALKIAELYDPLGPDNSAEASLLHFVWSADPQPRRLVLEGKDIRAIVTLSDIQKLPVRISLFSLFIDFALLLTEHLRYLLRTKSHLTLYHPRARK